MRIAAILLLLVAVMLPATTYSQPVPPAPGIEMPQAYFDRIADDKTAFQFQKAWIQKAQRAKETRQKLFADAHARGMDFASFPESVRESAMVAGTTQVPVMMGKYSNTGADPYPVADLQAKLFGVNPTGSMTDHYDEMSYGSLNVTGTVFPWVTVSNVDTYYEGGCNGLCGSAKTGQFILELLQANDPSVDFGQYDNDGPDGLPNSGDDDGFVDFIAVVHPEVGGECGTSNLWSHRWVVTGWPQFPGPWVTNDPRTGGGNIQVWDYTLMPALGSGNGCGGGITEIGVYCHEFGHAFGLPDFYDTNGGGQGIGHWGLMGSGNWNTSTNPAHMSAYSKSELGWLTPTEVDWQTQNYMIKSVEVNPEAYQLNVYEEKFSRKNFTPINGSYSMHCGLTTTEASARNYPAGSGHGNGWDECVQREFSYDGSNPVTLEYDYSYHCEPDYDYGYVKIDVNGTVSTLATYNGIGSGHATINLTTYLNGSGASSYEIIFQFQSDYAWSDEDGSYNTGASGPFKLDDVSVVGGGENYFTDYEQDEGGWCYDFTKNGHKEYFLVENRNKGGGAQFDQNLHGEGLMIWHVEEDVMNTSLGNSGGSSNTTARGCMPEQADGLQQLDFTGNRGDGGDIYPGTTNNTSFTNLTTPNSKSHNNAATNVQVINIGSPGTTVSADMRAGRFAPTLTSITPNMGDNDQVVSITDLAGTWLYKGGSFCLRDGVNEYANTPSNWVGKLKVTGDMDLNGVPGGTYDVVWKAPDGQEATLVDGFTVNPTATAIGDLPVAVNRLEQNHPNPFNPTTTISYSIESQGHVTLRVYNAAGQLVRTLVDEVQSPSSSGFSVVWDGRSESGAPVASGVYLYKLTAAGDFQSVRKLVLLK